MRREGIVRRSQPGARRRSTRNPPISLLTERCQRNTVWRPGAQCTRLGGTTAPLKGEKQPVPLIWKKGVTPPGRSALYLPLQDYECPYLLSSETTAKGTGLEKSAGKEDPVELDSNLALFGDMPRCSIRGRPGPRRAVSAVRLRADLEIPLLASFPHLLGRAERAVPAAGASGRRSSSRRVVGLPSVRRRATGARRGRRAVGLCPFVPGRG